MTETSFCPEKSRIQSRLCWRYIVLLPCRKDNANTHPEWIHLVRIFIKISFLQIITFYCSLKKLWEGNAFSRVCLLSGGRFPCDYCRSVYISSLGKSPLAPPTIMADPRGCQGRVPPGDPNCLIFIEFSAKKMENNRLPHPLWELAPPQETPRYATGIQYHHKGTH